jgi:hypothetical protein
MKKEYCRSWIIIDLILKIELSQAHTLGTGTMMSGRVLTQPTLIPKRLLKAKSQ